MTSASPRRPGPIALAALAVWILLLVLISLWVAGQSLRWLPVQASNAAPLVDGLFSFETGVGTFVFLGVISVMAWVVLVHRAEKYDESDAEPIEGNTRLEVIWTAIPLVLVMAIAWYAIQVNTELGVLGPMEHVHLGEPQRMAMGAPKGQGPAEDIEVIARQWSWEFRYPAANVSSTELHLQLDRPVTFHLVSEDVLHGFFIPAFRLGRYRLRDSQFSGTWFAANQADVVVESADDHAAWLQQAAAAPLQRGLSVAADEYAERQAKPRGGWPTVVPAPPPQVNVPGSSSLPHDA
jgi:cytochrome c oxidase subunit 2